MLTVLVRGRAAHKTRFRQPAMQPEKVPPMPLPQAAPRNLLHLRDVQLRGYSREDGLVEIEARMTDTKTYSFGNRDRGGIRSGEALHDMWLRVTIDREMVVQDCVASMDATPHHICSAAGPNFKRLVGLTIGKGSSSWLWRALAESKAARICANCSSPSQRLHFRR